MKIFLGNSPWLKPGFYGVRAGSRWPHLEKANHNYIPFPFFLAYATSVLEKNGCNVLLVDGIAERISLDVFYSKIKQFNPDIVVLEVSTISIDYDIKVAKDIKDMLDSVKIVFCGLHALMYNKEFLEKYPFIDFVMQGEYEYILLDLVNHLKEDKDLKDVFGIIYRDKNGNIQVNERRPPIENLDEIPWPARHFLPKDGYEDIPGILPKPTAVMWSTRGCPYSCIFCAWPQIMYSSNRYRVRDPIDVVNEMEHLIKKCGYKSAYFDDDIFNIGKKRVLKICEEIVKRELNIPWAVMARADTSDKETLEAMANAGLKLIKLGVESANQTIIDNAQKNLKLEDVIESVKIIKNLGIKLHLTFMFGLPGETKKTIRKTIKLAKSLDPDTLQFSIATPFPGSKYYDMLDKKSFIVSKRWQDYDGYNKAVIRTENLTPKDLEEAVKYAYKSWQKHIFWRELKKKDRSKIRIFVKKYIPSS